jgi:2-iminobutanoate/2-iminopropanoate deaminase
MTAKQGHIVEGAPPPAGPYNHAVIAGDFVYVAGQGPFDTAGERVGDSFAAQARQTFENLRTICEGVGASLDDAVRVGVFLSDMSRFAEMNTIYQEFFAEPRPVRTTVPVDLVGFDIEVDVVLYAPDRRTS